MAEPKRSGWTSQLLSTLGLLALVLAVVVLATGWVSRLWGPPLMLVVAGACFWAAAKVTGRGT